MTKYCLFALTVIVALATGPNPSVRSSAGCIGPPIRQHGIIGRIRYRREYAEWLRYEAAKAEYFRLHPTVIPVEQIVNPVTSRP